MAKPKCIPDHYVKAPPRVAFLKSAPYIIEVPTVQVVQAPEWSLLDWLKKMGFGYEPTPVPIPPPPPQEIQPADIRSSLGRTPMDPWEPADVLYGASDKSVIVGVLKEYKVADNEYDENWFDCDDFTLTGRGRCKEDLRTRKMSGFDIWVGFQHQGSMYYHSMLLIFVIEDNMLVPRLVECQNYNVQIFPNDWEFWAMFG